MIEICIDEECLILSFFDWESGFLVLVLLMLNIRKDTGGVSGEVEDS